MNTEQPMYEWNTIPWRKLERNVFKLQKRIYQASKRGNSQQVKRLQRLLTKSWSAKALAVRKVTQDNTGKKTAGVDGVKSLNPKQRLELTQNLHLNEKAKPIRRVWIPKPGKLEKRPLGIPVMRDRATQALVKMAIEPQWEAIFEPNSYGFRPGRSSQDAIQALHDMLRHYHKYVLDADNAYMVRYADDFVILHNELKVIEKCKKAIEEWLKEIGLELKPSKTKVINTLKQFDGQQPGFNFLGYEVRQYQVSKYKSGKRPKGFITLIKPSKDSIQRHKDQIKQVVKQGKAKTQLAIINELNPIIRGWCNYYSTKVSAEAFKYLTHFTVKTLMKWSRRKHPKKSQHWIYRKYFGTNEGYQWTFMTGKYRLLRHSETKIIRWVKVIQDRSPYDGDWVYWSTRMGRHPEANKKVAYLLNQQKGRCSQCGNRFSIDDIMEIHHLDKNHRNNKWENLTLVHRHCHDEVHKTSA
jgi:retron-type reverse transcriptase